MKFLILTFLFSYNLYALETTYSWIQENSELSSGRCFEVDKKTLGKDYLKQVEEKLCRPLDTLYVFNLKEGNCYEVDSKTEGHKYYKRISTSNCKPEKTHFLIGKFLKTDGCYEVDAETNGKLYFKKSEMENCNQSEKLFTWEFKSYEYGNCYRVSKTEETIKVRVKEESCRPAHAIYLFIKEAPTKGICVEQHPTNPRLYSRRVNIEKCRPKKTVFVFYRSPDALKGSCYEIDEKSKGEAYINQVKTEICKNN